MERVKIKTMRESFEENYQAVSVPAKNKRGFKIKYVYTGQWMVCREDQAYARKIKNYVLSAAIISIILYIAASVQNSPVNYARGVSMFGLLALAPYVFLIIGAVQFALSKEKMTVSLYADITVRLQASAVIYAALLAVCGVLAVREVFVNGYELSDCFIGICFLLSAAEAASIVWAYRRLHYVKKENNDCFTDSEAR